MAITRTTKTKNFTRISNDTLSNKELSYGARGLLAYLLTKPDNWDVNITELTKNSPHGTRQIRSYIKELEHHNHITRTRTNTTKGFKYTSNIIESPHARKSTLTTTVSFNNEYRPKRRFKLAQSERPVEHEAIERFVEAKRNGLVDEQALDILALHLGVTQDAIRE